jgi:hypothetical protein
MFTIFSAESPKLLTSEAVFLVQGGLRTWTVPPAAAFEGPLTLSLFIAKIIKQQQCLDILKCLGLQSLTTDPSLWVLPPLPDKIVR